MDLDIIPGTIVTIVPYKDKNGSFRTGLSKEDKEYIYTKIGIKLHGKHPYYTRMWDEKYEGYKADPYRTGKILKVKSNIFDFITSKWLNVHPYKRYYNI